MFEESRNVHREANSRVGQTMNDPGIFENQSLEFWPPQTRDCFSSYLWKALKWGTAFQFLIWKMLEN